MLFFCRNPSLRVSFFKPWKQLSIVFQYKYYCKSLWGVHKVRSRSNHTSKCQCHSHSQYNGITPHSVCGAKGLYQNRESQVKKLKWGEEDVKASKSDPIGYNVTRKRNRVLLISVSSCIIFKFQKKNLQFFAWT